MDESSEYREYRKHSNFTYQFTLFYFPTFFGTLKMFQLQKKMNYKYWSIGIFLEVKWKTFLIKHYISK